MSGGSYDYAYGRVNDMADAIRGRANGSAERLAFANLLDRVAKAMHDIEWVDSGDYGAGDESAAIADCVSPADVLRAAIKEAEAARVELEKALAATPRPSEGREG